MERSTFWMGIADASLLGLLVVACFLMAVACSSSYGDRYKKGSKLLGINLGNIEKRITENIMAKVDKRYPKKGPGRPKKTAAKPARKGGAK